MILFQQALELIQQNVFPLGVEEVDLHCGTGRVLADGVAADIDSPPHRKSLMDGFAVRSEDINSGLNRLRVVDTLVAGDWPRQPIGTGEAVKIMTGAPIPEGADAVVMVEQTECFPMTEGPESSGGDPSIVQINLGSLEPNKHIAQQADNFAKGQAIFAAGHRIRPWDVGLLAEVGAGRLRVGRQPRVSILATGSELIDFGSIPDRGQIRNSNGPMLLAFIQSLGLSAELLPIAGDNPDELSALIQQGLKADLLILTGGVSAGMLDLVPRILADLGVVQLFHKVKMKPGKPIWFGVKTTPSPVYVFALPGNPVSSLAGFHLFVRSAIRIMEGADQHLPEVVPAQLAKNHKTRGDRDTFWPGRWLPSDSAVRPVLPLDWKGSSDLLTLGQANCLIYFPGDQNDYSFGQEVAVYPL